MPWNRSRRRALLRTAETSTIDLSQDRLQSRQQRWAVFRNRRRDDIETHVKIRVDNGFALRCFHERDAPEIAGHLASFRSSFAEDFKTSRQAHSQHRNTRQLLPVLSARHS